MSVKPEIETQSSPLDTLLLLVGTVLLVGGIAGFYYFEQYEDWMRWGGVIASTFLAVMVAGQSHMGKSAWHFIQGSRVELRKVVWPSRTETTQTTIAIIFIVALLGLMLWGLDSLLLIGTKFLTGQGG
ncbi:MAG: preprotein translocase subunit SecE [Gammaproteobacteria bacterium]|nr:preprotein translocase subunit SecE [Gammaproteobacteria bacterium]